MPSPEPMTRGLELAQRLASAINESRRAPRPGARALPILTGLTPESLAVEPLENVLAGATGLLVRSGKVFGKDGEIVYESTHGQERRLITLSRDESVERSAHAILGNVFVFEQAAPGRDPIQFAPPGRFVQLLLNNESTRLALPKILAYYRRPAFDDDYNLLSPGWDPVSGIMVHGPEVEPIVHPSPALGLPILDRLPPHLRTLLAGFCFRSPADAVNAVAAFLTGLLAALFVLLGKAGVLIDGNQAGLGKTLLARLIGVILDGIDPGFISYTSDDEELGKEICARVRGGRISVIIVDNAKVRVGGAISSPILESLMMAPRITRRILGQSAFIDEPNDKVWVVTMNDTKASPDLVSRGMPIRLHYQGNPGSRRFDGFNPIAYAIEHRRELLGELCGMVVAWNQAGRPDGPRTHRCEEWARTIGGILMVAGMPEFLGNLDEAAASFNSSLDELSALAEAAFAEGGAAILPPEFSTPEPLPDGQTRKLKAREHGLTASRWEPLFRKARVEGPKLDASRSQHAKATVIGNFLIVNVDREIPVTLEGKSGRARLLALDAGHNQKSYGFAFTWNQGITPPVPGRTNQGAPCDPSQGEPRDPDRPRQTVGPGRPIREVGQDDEG